jgi:hypothetical protein
MNISVDQTTRCVLDAIDVFNKTYSRSLSRSLETSLVDAHGALDSLALVRFVVVVEQQVEDSFGVPISLFDEETMSQGSNPLGTVGALVEHLTSRLGARDQ